ncbi:MAG TPA: ATP-dependent DNA helicase RecG [Actinomycetota bacterium]|nr:ATP-dependent DNA helicase RecG [Actinomycetota bacterium]
MSAHRAGPPLTLASAILEIDPAIAKRRAGFRTKGDPAYEVLAGSAFEIRTVGDLLHHYPRRYIDRSRVETIAHMKLGAYVTVIARVRKVAKRLTRRRQTMVTVTLGDGTGYLDLTFFNQPWAATLYREGAELAVSGVATLYKGRLQLSNQEVEFLRGDDADLVHTARITPVHPAAEGVTTRTIRELLHRALERLGPIADPMPAEIVDAEGLGSYDRALHDIHFPADERALAAARERLKFDELFTLELGVAFRKHRVEAESAGVLHDLGGPLADRLLRTIPFEPTEAQRRAMGEIGAAMARPHPMNVLLQGDVGAGKTLVALHAALVAIDSGHQAAIMAPTEVLAGQHFRSVQDLLGRMGGVSYLEFASIRAAGAADGQASLLDALDGPSSPDEPTVTYALLTGAVTGKDRQRTVDAVGEGSVDLVVGTHALVQESVAFADLSLAVVDEQHRFGLHQRTALKRKGGEADVLIMTATPIPRTLALTYYGDLDVVLLDELPKGRLPIATQAARTSAQRSAAYELVREEVAAGRQGFVVCAAIDEGNRTQVKAAEAEAERLATEVFPDLHIELLHGRMRPKDKDAIMERFRAGEAHLLISTTVIEVGVDVPNATVMLVENAERFGLAQLHQLRGRIGRGEHPATCVLFDESDEDNVEARARIDAMVRTTDGFELADEDLRLRGEGTLFDAKQSGMPDLRLARLAEDMALVARARARAFAVIDDDPQLARHPELLDELRHRFERSVEWLFRS